MAEWLCAWTRTCPRKGRYKVRVLDGTNLIRRVCGTHKNEALRIERLGFQMWEEITEDEGGGHAG